MDGQPDELGAVVKRPYRDPGRKEAAVELGHLFCHVGHRPRWVFEFFEKDDALDIHVARGLPALVPVAQDAVGGEVADFDAGQVLDQDGDAGPVVDDDVADVVGPADAAQAADIHLGDPYAEEPAAGIAVVGGDGLGHVLDPQPELLQAQGIDHDLELADEPSEIGHVDDPVGLQELGDDDVLLQLGQALQGHVGRGFDDVTEDLAHGHGHRAEDGLGALGKLGFPELLQDQLAGQVEVDAVVEDQADLGEAEDGPGALGDDARHGVQGPLDGDRNLLFHLLGGQAAQLGDDIDFVVADIGVSFDLQPFPGQQAKKDDQEPGPDGHQAMLQDEGDQAVHRSRAFKGPGTVP